MFDMPDLTTDELDPSRPFHGSDEPEFRVEEEEDPLKTDLGPGFPDGTGAVRVWVDEHARLKRVRLSLRWKEKAPRAADLSSAFAEAMKWAQARIVDGPILPVPKPRPLEVPAVASFEAANRRLEALRDISARVKTMAPIQIVGGGSVGHGAGGRVTVKLGQLGDTLAVEFDEDWLADARSSQVAAAVLEAHNDAYARYTAPTMEASEYLELQGELNRMKAELFEMLKNFVN